MGAFYSANTACGEPIHPPCGNRKLEIAQFTLSVAPSIVTWGKCPSKLITHSTNPARTVVLKFGTGILTKPGSVHLDAQQFSDLTQAVASVQSDGTRCIVVSSGAVGAGLAAFNLNSRPTETAMLQACAAVGQGLLMHRYSELFEKHDYAVAQLLVTSADFQQNSRRALFGATLTQLLDLPNVIPVINENDSVATEELRFGDNDALSADVAALAKADTLILFTAVDGLANSSGDLIPEVTDIDDALQHVRSETGHLSVGGMASKLEAVRKATASGVETIIANGRNPSQLSALLSGGGIATRFKASEIT